MKKLITVILILALAVPSLALAVDGTSPFFGKWAGIEHHSMSKYSTILHYISINSATPSEYYVMYLNEGGGFMQGKITEQEIYSGHWEIVDDHIRVPTSGISYIDLYYDKETDTLYTVDWPKVTYVRLP